MKSYDKKETAAGIIAGIIAAGLFLLLLFAAKWNFFISLAIAAAAYAGFSLLFRPVKKLGGIDADSIDGGEEMLKRLEAAQEGFLRIEGSMRQINDSSVRSEAEQLHAASARIIPKLSAEVQRQNDPMAGQLLYGFEENLARFESRMHDLELSRTVALQSAPQMKLIQTGNSVMAQKIQSAVLNTVPIWKNQFAAAVGLTDQTAVYKTQRELEKMTSAMVKQNAEILRQSAVQTAAVSTPRR